MAAAETDSRRLPTTVSGRRRSRPSRGLLRLTKVQERAWSRSRCLGRAPGAKASRQWLEAWLGVGRHLAGVGEDERCRAWPHTPWLPRRSWKPSSTAKLPCTPGLPSHGRLPQIRRDAPPLPEQPFQISPRQFEARKSRATTTRSRPWPRPRLLLPMGPPRRQPPPSAARRRQQPPPAMHHARTRGHPSLRAGAHAGSLLMCLLGHRSDVEPPFT